MRLIEGIRNRKYFVIFLALFMVFSVVTASTSHAALTAGKSGKTVWTYLGTGKDGKAYKSTNTGNKQPKYSVKVGSATYTGYCINPNKGWGSGKYMVSKSYNNSSAISKYSAAKKELLSYVLLYGYNSGKSAPYGNINDYYAATQTVVWQVLEGNIVMNSEGKWTKNNTSDKAYKLIKGHSYGVKCYEYIKKEMSGHVVGSSFTKVTAEKAKNSKYIMKYNYKAKSWSITLNDTKGINYLKQKSATSGLTMIRSGKNYTFTTKNSGNYTSTLTNDKNYGSTQSAMVFDSGTSSIQSVALGATDTKMFYVAFETEKTGMGQIIKVDEKGNRLSGFKFKVKCQSNGYENTLTTDDNGTISASLYPGIYTVEEVLNDEQIKNNWQAAEATKLNVTAGKTSSIEVKNIREKKATLKIVKKTSDGGPVEGFKFKIEGHLFDQKTLIADEIINMADPSYEDSAYEVSEWSIVDEDIIDSINQDAKSGKTGSYVVRLKAIGVHKVSDSISKSKKSNSKESVIVAGADTEISSANSTESSNGSAEETLSVTESTDNETSESEKGEDGKKTININTHVTVTTSYASDEDTNIIKKTDDNVTVNDFTWNGVATKYSNEFSTNDKGIINIDNIQFGEYEISEAMNKNQSIRYETPTAQKIKITEENQDDIEPFVFENKAKESKVKVIKKCSDGSVENIKFKITGKTSWGETLTHDDSNTSEAIEGIEAVTDENGIADFGYLPPGEYIATEVDVDLDKYMPIDPQKFTITGNEKNGEVIELTFENKPKSDLTISKQDATTGKELPGAKLQLIDKDTDEIIEEWESTSEPNIIKNLSYGKVLILKELISPSLITDKNRGYINGNEEYVTGFAKAKPIEITVGSQDRVTMIDELTQVVVTKQDATTSTELPGATLQIVDPETNRVIHQWTSTKEPHVIEGLIDGKEYILRENQAPTGYDIAEEIKFTVGRDSEIVMYDKHAIVPVKDTPEKKTPETGDKTSTKILMILGGLATAAMLVACIIIATRRRA